MRIAMLFALLSLPATIYAQFEGVVESANITTDETGTQQKFTMTIWVKGQFVRVETSPTGSSPGMTMIFRPDRKVQWVVIDSGKTYFEVPIEGDAKSVPPKAQTDLSKAVKKTGKSKKILGYGCDEYRITHDEVSTEIWGTRSLVQLQTALATAFGGDREEGEWSADIRAIGVYPMIAVTRVDGVVVESQEVIRIEKQTLAPGLFELPAGYTKHKVEEYH
jgi:hypothetical protein